jgi:hypothetical protein
MKKLAIKTGLLIWAASLLLAGFSVPVQAAGESYRWQDSGKTTIVAEGGIYAQPTTFTESSRNGGAITYTTNADSFSCTDGTSFDADLRITVSLADHQASNSNTPARLAAQTRCGLNPDTSVSITSGNTSGGSAETVNSSVDRDSCDGGVLSWVLCPVFSWITESIEWIENDVIIPFLRVDPLTFDTDNPQHTMWRNARNLANVGFVLVMLMIVFANTVSFQMDYYTIKRSIPRLAVAAIAVQFSYLIVALLIDITNILGEGIGNLVLSPVQGQDQVTITNLIGGLGLAGAVTALFAAAGSVLTGGILIVVLAAFFAVMAVFVTLVFRQVLITFLLIVSPIAILAWVLPNTEGWFKLWKNTLIKTLMMYPILVIFFVSGKIFGAATASGTGGGAMNDSFRSLISVVSTILPLLLVPLAFKFAGSAMTAGGALIGRLLGTTRGMAEQSGWYERLKRRTDERRVGLAAGQPVRFGAGPASFTLGKVGGRAASRLVRGPFSDYGKAAAVRAMLDFNQIRDQKLDMLKKEGTTFTGFEVLSKGEAWARNEIIKARGEGNTARAEDLERTLVEARNRGRLYDSASRAAALKYRADLGVIGNSDLEGVRQWMGAGETGQRIGDANWRSAREGVRKITPHLTFTNLDGSVDNAGLIGWWISQNQSTMSGFTSDAFEKMRDNGTLELMAQTESGRDVLHKLAGGGGPAAGAAQQSIIKSVLNSTPAPAPGAPGVEFAYVDNNGQLRAISRATAQAYKDSGQGARVIKIDKSVADLT